MTASSEGENTTLATVTSADGTTIAFEPNALLPALRKLLA